LLPKLSRVISLKPDHKQAHELAGQLRNSALKGAKARLAQHRYQEAVQILAQIPALIVTDEVQSLLDEAEELSNLLGALKQGALAEPSLLALADRLCRLAPENKDAVNLRRQLDQRIKSKPVDARLPAPSWARPPERTILGAPVDPVANFVRC